MRSAPALAALWIAWGALAALNYAACHPVPAEAYLDCVGAPLVSAGWRHFGALAVRAAAAGAVLLVELLAAWRLGNVLLRWIRPAGGQSDAPLFRPLAGLGAAGLLALGAGLCGFFGPVPYLLLFGIPCAGAMRHRRDLPRPAFRGLPAPWLAAALAAAAAVQAAALLSALAPAHVSDELVYHLGLARWYLGNHRIVAQPGNMLAAFPHLDTMLYGAAESWGLVFGVKWLHWAAGGLAVLGVVRLLEREAAEIRWLAAAALGTMPVLWTFGGRAFSDLFLAACGAGAVLAARRRAGVLAGLCVGLAAGFKYSGFLLGLVLVPLLPLRALPAAAVAAVVTAGPWLFRNWILFANPVHPLLWKLFHDRGWDEKLAWRLRHEGLQGEPSLRGLATRLPALPWLLPVRGLGGGPDGSTGILLALGAPALLTACRWREAAALVAFAVPTAFMGVGFRYLLPVLPLMAAVAARGAAPLLGRRPLRGPALAAAAALVWWQAAEFIPAAWKVYDDPLPVVLGQEPAARYLDRMCYPRLYYPFPVSWPARAAAESTPPNARILFLGGFGGAWNIPRWCAFTPLQGRPFAIDFAREARGPERIAKRFRQLGITHVLVNRWLGEIYLDYWHFWDWGEPGTVDRWIAFWDRHAAPVRAHGRHLELFSISKEPAPGPHRLIPGFESEVVQLGVVLVNRRRQDEAARLLSDLVPTFPRNPGLWMALGMARVAQGRLDEARECARRARALAPGSAADLRARAAVAAATGSIVGAADLAGRAARMLRDDRYAWLEVALLEYRLGHLSCAWWAERECWKTRDYLNER